jgi:hypothetical protein
MFHPPRVRALAFSNSGLQWHVRSPLPARQTASGRSFFVILTARQFLHYFAPERAIGAVFIAAPLGVIANRLTVFPVRR